MRLNPFRRLESKAADRMLHPASGGYWHYPWHSRTQFDYRANLNRDNSALVAVTSWVARNIVEPPVLVVKRDSRGDWQPVDGHPLPALCANPNPFYSGLLMLQALAHDWLFDGNAYLIKARSGAGRAVELWWVPCSLMTPHFPPGQTEVFIDYYEYTPGGEPIRLDPADVVHFRNGLDPANPRKGLSPLNALLKEIFSDDEASNFSAALLRNMGVPGLVLIPKGGDDAVEITPDDAEAIAAKMTQETTGDHRGSTRVLRDAFELHEIGFNPQQLDLKELHRLPEERISAVFGVAAIVVGLGAGLDRSTFANFAEAREAATEQNLVPTWRLFAAELQRQLLPDFGASPGLEVRFDLAEVRALQEDENSKSTRLVAQLQGGLAMRSEVRAAMGYDTSAEDEVYYVPVSTLLLGPDNEPVVEVEELPEPAPFGEEPEEPPGESDTNAPETPQERAEAASRRWPVSTHSLSKVTRRDASLMQALGRDRAKVQAEFTKALQAAFTELGNDAAAAYLRAEAMVPGKAVEPTPRDERIAVAIQRALKLDTWAETQLGPIYEVYFSAMGAMTYDTVSVHLGVDLAWNIADPLARSVVAEGGTRLGLLDIAEDTKGALYRALAETREAGLGPPDAARLIRQYVPEGPYTNAGSQYRATMIARTETHYAQNVSTLAAYRQSDVVTGVRAFDNQTGYGDADCSARDGQTYTLDDAANVIDHPNGTLNWAPVVGR